MNIMMIIPDLNSRTHMLQPWSYFKNLCSELNLNGFNIKIYTNLPKNKSLILKQIKGMKINYFQLYDLKQINKNYLSVIYNKKPDLIYWFGNSFSGLYLKRISNIGIPIILYISSSYLSLNDMVILKRNEYLDHIINLIYAIYPFKLLIRTLNNRYIKYIVVNNEINKNKLIKLGVIKEKILTQPLFYNKKIISYNSDCFKKLIKKYNNKLIITYMGGPDTVRGTDIIIKSVNYLRDFNKNMMFLLLIRHDQVDYEKNLAYLKKLIIKYKVKNNITIIPGTLDRKTLFSYVELSDLIVLPFKITRSEPPLALFESMLFRKPVISTYCCGLRTYFPKNYQYLSKPGDHISLANLILLLCFNSQLREKVKNELFNFVMGLPGNDEFFKFNIELINRIINEQGKYPNDELCS